MRALDLIDQIRRNLVVTAGTLPDYTDAVIYDEIDASLTTVFERIVTGARSGYWCKPYAFSTVVGTSKYRVPARAIVGGLEKVELAFSTTASYLPLPATTEEQAADYDRSPATSTSSPQAYVMRGDQVVILPTPNTVLPVRFWYYVRPSRCVAPQSGLSVTLRGQVTAFNPTARTITVNTPPFDQELAVPAAITSALQRIDVVHPDGWHELALVGATQTLAGSVFTVGGTDPLDEVQIGDFVRVSEQTDWPCLPDDFHDTLASATTVRILITLGLRQKAADLSERVTGDLQRFTDQISPRVKADPDTIPLGGGWGGVGAAWGGWWG